MVEEPGEVLVGRLLERYGLRLAIAESCTGGLVGHRLTNVPGASTYFLGGVIAYSNELKVDLLGVRPEILERYGAVSEQAVLEMARGARNRLNADLGFSVSGIAGPDGGTPEKPVGLVWFGLSATYTEKTQTFIFSGNRVEIKYQAAGAGLDLLADFLQILTQDLNRQPAVVTSEYSSVAGQPNTELKARYPMDSIEVTVRFDAQGKATPLQFSWRGQDYRVESTGRRWEDENGQHLLVMIPGGRVFEILFSADNGRWYLRKTGENRMKV
jgi:nicotinamide-nucleotide amidase